MMPDRVIVSSPAPVNWLASRTPMRELVRCFQLRWRWSSWYGVVARLKTNWSSDIIMGGFPSTNDQSDRREPARDAFARSARSSSARTMRAISAASAPAAVRC